MSAVKLNRTIQYQDIINTTAKAFLRKYGVFMLADALLLIIINICAFMLSLNFIDGDFAKQLPICANPAKNPCTYRLGVCRVLFLECV